jgi:hypothetical protein
LKNEAHAAKYSAQCCIGKKWFKDGFLMRFSIFTKKNFTQKLYLPNP